VADRRNCRIQIFDQEGNLLDIWTEFGMPSGLYIDKNDILYCTDSESTNQNMEVSHVKFPNTGWKRGVRIGSTKDGMVTAFVPDHGWEPNVRGSTGAEGIAADDEGNLYLVGVNPMGIRKYIKK
jgi:hypothetical protein